MEILKCFNTVKEQNVAYGVTTSLSLEEPSPPSDAQTDAPEGEEPTAANRKRRHAEPAAPLPVAVVIVYKSMGQLLPERYDPDRRSLR